MVMLKKKTQLVRFITVAINLETLGKGALSSGTVCTILSHVMLGCEWLSRHQGRPEKKLWQSYIVTFICHPLYYF
jgi:hypothetical protein